MPEEATTHMQQHGESVLQSPERGGDSVLEVAFEIGRTRPALEVNFTLRAPWTILFGASGSGKSTILRAIAGFVRPDSGRVVSTRDNAVLQNTSRGIWLPPHERPVRMAGQTARLFPHLSTSANLRFGVRSGEEDGVLKELARLLRIGSLLERRPRELSGGEQQRVAVARAAASAVPAQALLLLDEPFAGMDIALRDKLAPELCDWLRTRGVPVLSVTHEVSEAFLLGAEVLRLREGRIEAQGSAAVVLAAEREAMLGRLRG